MRKILSPTFLVCIIFFTCSSNQCFPSPIIEYDYEKVVRFEISNDGSNFYADTFSLGTIHVNLNSGEYIKNFQDNFYLLNISKDSTRLVGAFNPFTAGVWNAENGENLIETQGGHYVSSQNFPMPSVRYAVISSDNESFFTSSPFDGRLVQWDMNTGEEIFEMGSGVGALQLSNDDKILYTGGFVFDIPERNILYYYPDERVNDIVLSASEDYYIIATHDQKKAVMIDNDSYEIIRTFEGHESYVFSVDISPDGLYLITGSNESIIRIWNIESGKLLNTIYPQEGDIYSKYITKARFLPDGKRVMILDNRGKLSLWDFEDLLTIESKINDFQDYK